MSGAALRAPARTPRLGFLGTGWIGRQRMAALLATGQAQAAALADPDQDALREAAALAPEAAVGAGIESLLAEPLDGLVIATPSALHAEQATAALERGLAVFCQKPLARSEAEAAAVLDAARSAGRLLGVDLSYRHTRAGAALREGLQRGDIGTPYALELVFHNAYGPDKPWFTSRRTAGGGCLIDLGTHLIDMALWLTGSESATPRGIVLRRGGRPLGADPDEVEDYALTTLDLDGDAVARVACSWFLPAGRDCVFECTVLGSEGALSMRNVDGSFYDFRLEHHVGTTTRVLVEPPDRWGARALVAWARQLAEDGSFDPVAAEEQRLLAAVIDRIYAEGSR